MSKIAKPYDIDRFLYDGSRRFTIGKAKTDVDYLYNDKKDYQEQLRELTDHIDARQEIMYAQDRYAMLAIFQAMDAAGKDGTIRRVFTGVNPHGLQIHAFKKPSDRELDHGYMWRTNQRMPERGRIGVFNRSYYEEVLIVRVRPGILTGGQRIPTEFTKSLKKVWDARYEDIRNFELYAARNGTSVCKFFLHVSKDEQKNRFLDRIDESEKNWKFSESDAKERELWDEYQKAYQDCIRNTATPHAPWYVVPADDKRNMRLIVAAIVASKLDAMDLQFPVMGKDTKARLNSIRKALVNS